MRKLADLTNAQYDRLTVIADDGAQTTHGKVRCQCNCGEFCEVRRDHLLSGATRSCGCLWRETRTKHGHASTNVKSAEYRAWCNLKTRCLNPNTPYYARYGGRGIAVCPRWLDSFQAFLDDMGERPPGTTLDRWPNMNGDYEPGNCRWATPKQQQRNLRTNRVVTVNQMTLCVTEWAELVGESVHNIATRLRRGWPTMEAVFGRAA